MDRGKSEDRGWSRPSQDWNKEGSHRYNTGGSYEDYQDRNRDWSAGRLDNFRTGNRLQDFGREQGSPGQYAGRGPKGYLRTDERIKEEVCERLTRDPHVDASDIEIEVKDGEVTLTGTVYDRRQKRAAEDAVDAIFGVNEVHNRIRVQQNPSHSWQSPSL